MLPRHLYFLIGMLIVMPNLLLAQYQTKHWVLGHELTLQFASNTSPTVTNISPIRQIEGVACISNPQTGELLFYSDGIKVWNKHHQTMPKGINLLGSITSTQSALIVPWPNHPNQYALFTVKAYSDGMQAGLHYSVIDLSLDYGRGDLAAKNILLETTVTEKLTAIPHANGTDYWILSHAYDSNEFLVYLLTSEGITISKRIAIGSKHQASRQVAASEAMGYLKASPNGKLLAAAVYGKKRPFELFDFDAQTGEISNARSLGNFSGQYGVSFSPDNSKLYLSGLYAREGAYQFDLLSKGYAAKPLLLQKTGTSLPRYVWGALQLGSDGKLYTCATLPLSKNLCKLAVLESPNEALKENAFQWLVIPSHRLRLGLPNFIQSYFNQANTRMDLVKRAEPINVEEQVMIYPNPVFAQAVILKAPQPDLLSEITIRDVQGKVITGLSLERQAEGWQINTSTLPANQVYVLSYRYLNQGFAKRIVKH